MKILVIAPEPFFTPRGTPLSVYYRTLVTAQLGVEVDLLTYGEGRDVEIERVRIIRIPWFRRLGPVPVGPSRLKAFLDVWLLLWALVLLVRHRYDCVHAHEEAIFLCRFLKPIFRFKLVYDMHSCLPQQLTNFRFTTSRFLIRLFERLERASLRACDAVITICPDLRDYALRQIDDPAKHFLIENSIFDPVKLARRDASEEIGAPACKGDANPQTLPEGRRLLVYAGTLEPYQGIGLLLRAFQKARERVPDAHLVIVGGTPDQVARYCALAEELELESSCTFRGAVSPELAKAYCARADVLLSPRVDGTNTPLKIYEQLASGIPIVATDIYAHTQVLDGDVAFLAKPDPEDLSRALVSALNDPVARERRAEAAHRLYESRYSRASYVSKMRQLLERVR